VRKIQREVTRKEVELRGRDA